MDNSKDRLCKMKKIPLHAIGILLLILIAVSLLWYNHANSNQASDALVAKVYFAGEYRIGDGEWKEIIKGQHIPSTKGDVTLKGNFHMLTPDDEYVGLFPGGSPIAFYTDHVNLTIYEGDVGPFQLDNENPIFGKSACGKTWTGYNLMGDGTDTMTIIIHNPHRFGNENAVDDFLSNVAIWANIDFERSVLNKGKSCRNIGMLFVMAALSILGMALFLTLLYVKRNRIVWLIGLTVFFAGGYFAYSDTGVSFWSKSIANNTTILGASMMFYMLFMTGIITYFLKENKRIGVVTTTVLGCFVGVCFVLPMLTEIYFYDTLVIWILVQSVVNVVIFGCMVREFSCLGKKGKWGYVGITLFLLAFEADVVATALGWWQGGLISEHIFAALFVAGLVTVLKIIPEGIHATEKARELELQRSRLEREKSMIETELKENRIAIMLSQIRPHFIYNTLGTIERMCLYDPKQAFELVRNFSLYLRGNFSELESVTPIRFSDEIKHVEHYVNIEKVRFPDMCIEYELETMDFVLPALSVQPLVENAIKHGLMRRETGGHILIQSYETETHFCVEVKDDGVGYDLNQPVDGKKHVGLRNIAGRLKNMVNGELVMESEIDRGTKAKIMIPKEVTI